MAEQNIPPHQKPPQEANSPQKPEPAVPSTDEFSPKPKLAEGKVTKESKEAADTKETLHKKIEAILAQNGGRESDIPPSHEYWQFLNQYRSMK
jgi:hypothetical protein